MTAPAFATGSEPVTESLASLLTIAREVMMGTTELREGYAEIGDVRLHHDEAGRVGQLLTGFFAGQ